MSLASEVHKKGAFQHAPFLCGKVVRELPLQGAAITRHRKFYTLNRKPYTLKRKSYTLKRKFLFRTPCNVSITIDKNKQNSVSASESYLPYISPLCVESYALPKAKLGEVIRLRAPFTPRKDISDHSVIASCRQSWVLSGSGLMRGLAEREECQKFFENKSEIWKVGGRPSSVGMEVAA